MNPSIVQACVDCIVEKDDDSIRALPLDMLPLIEISRDGRRHSHYRGNGRVLTRRAKKANFRIVPFFFPRALRGGSVRRLENISPPIYMRVCIKFHMFHVACPPVCVGYASPAKLTYLTTDSP